MAWERVERPPPRVRHFGGDWILSIPALRRSEWLLFVFFVYVAALGELQGGRFPHPSTLVLLIPMTLVALALADSRSSGRIWSMLRDWVPALLMLVAYWSADWVPQLRNDHSLERALIGFDRTLLNDWGLRTAIERFGTVLPSILELAYLMVYAVPPLAIAYFYIRRERRRLDDFLFPFLFGLLMTYSLLPHFPSEAPRFVFAGQDLPGVDSIFRRFNLWILNQCDIHSSVFPSGHVTAAFSAAFAMLLALPEKRRVGWMLLAVAILVLINTVYGRYHYAADGLAAVAISLAGFAFVGASRARTARRHT